MIGLTNYVKIEMEATSIFNDLKSVGENFEKDLEKTIRDLIKDIFDAIYEDENIRVSDIAVEVI